MRNRIVEIVSFFAVVLVAIVSLALAVNASELMARATFGTSAAFAALVLVLMVASIVIDAPTPRYWLRRQYRTARLWFAGWIVEGANELCPSDFSTIRMVSRHTCLVHPITWSEIPTLAEFQRGMMMRRVGDFEPLPAIWQRNIRRARVVRQWREYHATQLASAHEQKLCGLATYHANALEALAIETPYLALKAHAKYANDYHRWISL